MLQHIQSPHSAKSIDIITGNVTFLVIIRIVLGGLENSALLGGNDHIYHFKIFLTGVLPHLS